MRALCCGFCKLHVALFVFLLNANWEILIWVLRLYAFCIFVVLSTIVPSDSWVSRAGFCFDLGRIGKFSCFYLVFFSRSYFTLRHFRMGELSSNRYRFSSIWSKPPIFIKLFIKFNVNENCSKDCVNRTRSARILQHHNFLQKQQSWDFQVQKISSFEFRWQSSDVQVGINFGPLCALGILCTIKRDAFIVIHNFFSIFDINFSELSAVDETDLLFLSGISYVVDIESEAKLQQTLGFLQLEPWARIFQILLKFSAEDL